MAGGGTYCFYEMNGLQHRRSYDAAGYPVDEACQRGKWIVLSDDEYFLLVCGERKAL